MSNGEMVMSDLETCSDEDLIMEFEARDLQHIYEEDVTLYDFDTLSLLYELQRRPSRYGDNVVLIISVQEKELLVSLLKQMNPRVGSELYFLLEKLIREDF